MLDQVIETQRIMQMSRLLEWYFPGVRYVKYLNDSPTPDTSTYVARLELHSSKYIRMVIVVVPKDENATLTVVSASQLSNWMSIQTIDKHDSPFMPIPRAQEWLIPHVDTLGIMLQISSRSEKWNEYTYGDYRVRLDIDDHDRNCYKYPDHLSLQQAINTFRAFIYHA
jgi:hypothetical protein